MRTITRAILPLLALTLACPRGHAQQTSSALQLSGDFRGTHDPSIAKDGDTFYVFATGAAYASRPDAVANPAPGDAAHTPPPVIGQFPVRCSKDLTHWKFCGQVFQQIPQWIRDRSPATRELWAPDVSFYDGLYHLYYAYSVFGKNTSGIALATNKTLDPTRPDYKWNDQGLVLESTAQDDFNAIDPNLVLDRRGQAWLSFGSFWSGIKMRRIDRATGKLSPADTRTYALATRKKPADAAPAPPGLPPDWEAIEAPFILQHGDFYYLFASWDLCCRGLKSTYHTVVGRSRSITGPYLDQSGTPMMRGGGTPLLNANDTWLGPGGESLLHLPTQDIIVFHAYDAHTGKPALQVSTIAWTKGWPHVAMQRDTASQLAPRKDP